MKPGRKDGYESFKIKQRYAALTEPYFLALKGFLDSEDPVDRKFAISELSKAYTKMIPTEITGEGGQAIIIQVAKETAEKYGIASSPSDNSTGSAQI